MDLDKEKANLNEKQLQTYNNILGGGYSISIAVPGSGKTKTVTVSVAGLIFEKKIEPETIFVSTFTKKAAEEMKERIALTIGEEKTERLNVYTFHAFCFHMIRRFGAQYVKGLNTFKMLADEQDMFFKTCFNKIIQKLLSEEQITLGEAETTKNLESSFLSKINDLKNRNILLNQYFAKKDKRDMGVRMFFYAWSEYEKTKNEKNYLDFNDILLVFNKLLNTQAFANLVKVYTEYIIVDEYQDTNDLQMEILNKLNHGNLAVVGDDAQSIYAFRNANVKLILDFEKKYNAKIVHMDINYRSHSVITNAATELISNNESNIKKEIKNFFPVPSDYVTEFKTFVTSFDEANYISTYINDNRSKLGTVGIIYRNNIIGEEIAKQLKKRGIFYDRKEEYNIFDRKEVKLFFKLLSYYKTGSDDTLEEIMLEQKGIGEKAIDELKNLEGDGNLLDKALMSSKKIVRAFAEIIKPFRLDPDLKNVINFFNFLFHNLGFKDMEEKRVENLLYLRDILVDYEDITELSIHKLTKLRDESVRLLTCHSSKGLEFDTCFIPAFSETIIPAAQSIPDHNALEEERRLAYVAITRAKKNLIITHANTRFDYEAPIEVRKSSFLSEFNTTPFGVDNSDERSILSNGSEIKASINNVLDNFLN